MLQDMASIKMFGQSSPFRANNDYLTTRFFAPIFVMLKSLCSIPATSLLLVVISFVWNRWWMAFLSSTLVTLNFSGFSLSPMFNMICSTQNGIGTLRVRLFKMDTTQITNTPGSHWLQGDVKDEVFSSAGKVFFVKTKGQEYMDLIYLISRRWLVVGRGGGRRPRRKKRRRIS